MPRGDGAQYRVSSQNAETITIAISGGHGFKFKKSVVEYHNSSTGVTAGIKDGTICLQGDWYAPVAVDDCFWTIENGELVLHIEKTTPEPWPLVIGQGLKGDDSRLDAQSRFNLGLVSERDGKHDEALDRFNQSADGGFYPALRKLAAIYSPNGEEKYPGIDKDPEKSVAFVKKGADSGNADAQFILSHAFLVGFGVEKDNQVASEYLQKAADGEHLYAMFEYGSALREGTDVVEKNCPKAAELFERCALQMHPVAAMNLGTMLVRGEGIERDVRRGVKWMDVARRINPNLKPPAIPEESSESAPASAEKTQPTSEPAGAPASAEEPSSKEVPSDSEKPAGGSSLVSTSTVVVCLAAVAIGVFAWMRSRR